MINFSGNNGPGMIADCSPYKSPCAHYKNRAAVKSMMGNFVDGQNAGFTLRSRLKVDDECYHIFSELSFNTLVQSLPAYPDSEAKTFVDCKLCSRSDMQCADSVFGVRTQLVAPYMPLASDVDGENDSGLPVINFVAPDIFDDECYRMFSELSFSTMVQSFPAYPDSETKAYVDCKLCSRSDMQCTASVFGVRTQLVAPHMHLASDVNGENGSGPPVINFSGNNGPGMIADCSPYKSPCAHYKNRAAVKSMMGNFVDGQNAGFTLRSRLKVDDECYHIFSELSFNTLVQSLPAYPDSEAKTFVDCKLCSRSDMQCADSVFGVRTQLVAPYMPLASDVDGENDSGLPVINFVAPDIFDDECYRMFSELSFSTMVQSFPAYPDSETKAYVDCKLCSRSDMQCTASVFGVRTQLVAPHMPLASDVDGENGSGLPVINFCGNDVAPDIVDDECYCMFSELSFSTMVQSFRAYPDSDAKAYVDSKLCSCSGMRCTVNVIGCCIQLVASHIHQASDVDGENGSGPPVINFCGNNGHGMIADCSPYKSPCACFKNRVPLRVPLFPCADGDLATFRFRLCPFGFRCWMPVFNSACQVACSVQHSINQAACEVSCDQFSPRLDAHATLGLSAFTIAAHRAPCTSALTEAMHELDHNHLHGCRIGEASHPGPGVTSQLSFLGPEFAKQIQAQIEAAVQAAVMQALSQLNIPGLAAGALSATRPRSHGDAQKPEAGPGPKKRKRKRKGKAKDAAAAANAEAEAPQPVRRVVVAGDDTNKRQGHRPDAGGRGKGKGGPKPHKGPAEPADDGWQLVRPKSRRDQDGEFTLRAEDWSAPIVEFSKLATFLDDAMAGTTLEAVVYIKPEQKEVAANLIRGAGSPYKFLLIYLDKKEGCRTPGMIDGKLVFRQAVVTRISSDQNLSGVPQPKGITANAVKIQPATETAVLFMKVYKNYASADFWKRFGSNPNRSIVHWASQHRMRILDAFAWATEKGRTDVGELYGGMARVRKSDLEGFLQLSGTQGIFIDTARRHGIQSKVSWVDRMSGETPSAYHERALRQGSDLGLVTNANRLGWRKKLAAGETEQRLWQVDGLPFEWDDEVVKQLLESNFGDITIMSHRRTRLGQNFRFKAASRQEGRDIVPLVAEDAKKNCTTYWATWALPANASVRRKPLPRAAVPVAQIPPLKTVAAPCKQAPPQDAEPEEGQTDSKPESEAKRSKQEVRALPEDLTSKTVPADGSCLFHAVSEGLKWLQDDRDAHPRVLRAETIEHMRRHCPTYEAEWDRKGPDGLDFTGTFAEYLTLMEQPTSYATDIEFKALARVLDVKLVIIPAGIHWQPMCFHHKAKRMLVLWYNALHIDLLLPKDGATKYPDSYVQITAGPTGGLRAGGVGRPPSVFTAASSSQVCRASGKTKPRSVFTAKTKPASVFTAPSFPQVRASAQVSGVQGHSHAAASVDAVAAERAQDHSDADSQDLQGCEAEAPKRSPSATWRVCPYRPYPPPPKNLTFKCEFCPFRKVCKSVTHYRSVRHQHCKFAHDGKGLPGLLLQPRLQRLPKRLSAGDWRCPLCPKGLRKAVVAQVTSSSLCQIRLRHWQTAHATEVSRKEWTALLKAQPKPKRPKQSTGAHAEDTQKRMLTKAVISEVQNARFPTLTMFAWPRRKSMKNKGERVTIEHAWSCNKCGRAIRRLKDAREHVTRECPPVPESLRTKHETELRDLSKWLGKHPESRVPPQIHELIESALKAVRRCVL